jgi:hypothetical protein
LCRRGIPGIRANIPQHEFALAIFASQRSSRFGRGIVVGVPWNDNGGSLCAHAHVPRSRKAQRWSGGGEKRFMIYIGTRKAEPGPEVRVDHGGWVRRWRTTGQCRIRRGLLQRPTELGVGMDLATGEDFGWAAVDQGHIAATRAPWLSVAARRTEPKPGIRVFSWGRSGSGVAHRQRS